MKRINRDVTRRTPPPSTRTREAQPQESLIELLARDLEAWRLARGVITKAKTP